MKKVFTVAILIACAACSIGAEERSSTPLTFKSPTDSVRVIFGDFDKWVSFNTAKDPDTSHLNMEHDLILLSASESLFVARSKTPVPIRFLLPSGERTEVFMFYIPIDTTKVLLLKQYPRFAEDSISRTLRPVYRRSDDSTLARMRSGYNLDSIAGQGMMVEQIVRLLGWVHTKVRHDGNRENPPGNSFERLSKCVDSGATMNCGGLAHLLADVYAAVGFKARTVVGMPYDTADFECHQFTEVWSDSLQKWIFMDPTNHAYFTDILGNFLQIDQVRQELALGDPTRRNEFIRINDDINWNGEPMEKERYLHYMAKNLFRFRTWAYPTDESTEQWTIELTPKGYTIFPAGLKQDSTGTTFRTHDISLFWMPPNYSEGH